MTSNYKMIKTFIKDGEAIPENAHFYPSGNGTADETTVTTIKESCPGLASLPYATYHVKCGLLNTFAPAVPIQS